MDGGQDRKFKFENGQFVNRVSGEAIPADEPIIIFRARDHHSLPVLREYLTMATDEHHRAAIRERMSEFGEYALANPDKMKEPGITHHIALNSDAPTTEATIPEGMVQTRKLSDAPCDQCGYNGPGYYQPDAHPCAAAHHAALATTKAPTLPVAETFQASVKPWLMECFGEMIAGDREERNHRFLEEALELVQACGCTAHEAHQLVDYVYGRPVGALHQEIGGVMVTLAALCLANDADMHAAGWVELDRVWGKVEAIRAKQAAKPKHSPLPAAPPVVGDREAVARLIAREILAQDGCEDDALKDDLTIGYLDQGEVDFGKVADAILAALSDPVVMRSMREGE